MFVQICAARRMCLLTLLGAFLFLASPLVGSAVDLPPDAPILISEENSTHALLNTPRGRRSFGRAIPVGGQATVYVTNLQEILKDEGRTAFRADIQDENYYRYPLEIVSFVPTRQRPWVYALTFRLHPQLGSVGDALLRVTWRGMSSNRVRVSIGHQGGKIQDDPGSTPTPMPDSPISTPTSEAVSPPWTGDRVRFMMQTTFGVNASLEHRLRRIGYSTWLEEQFEQKYAPNGEERFSSLPYPGFRPGTTTPPLDCNGTSGPQDPVDPDPLCFRNNYSMFPMQNWFFREALYGEDHQLRRRVSWALSQIFVVGGRELEQSGRMREYVRLLDRHAFANFRDILRVVTLSPAMGDYLDMARSTRQNPNENYAREILQLFSVGVDLLNQDGTPVIGDSGSRIPTYTQAHVDNFTKVFTGWSFCSLPSACPSLELGIVNYYDSMIVNPANHDPSSKVLFRGEVVPAGMDPNLELSMAIDNIFHHPNVAPFISKLLIQQLVTSNPTPAYVGRVSAAFRNNGQGVRGDMKRVIRAILLDPEARGNIKTDPDYGKLREPVLFITNLLRPFNPQSQATAPASCNGQSDGVLNVATIPLDQDVFVPPTVFNYYPMDYIIPGTNLAGPEFGIMSTGTALKRPNFVNQFVSPNNVPATPGVGIVTNQPGTNPNYAPCGTRIDLARLVNLALSDPSAGSLVDQLNLELLNGGMSAQMRSDIMNALAAIPSSNTTKRARTALYLVATSPQFQVQR